MKVYLVNVAWGEYEGFECHHEAIFSTMENAKKYVEKRCPNRISEDTDTKNKWTTGYEGLYWWSEKEPDHYYTVIEFELDTEEKT